MLYHDQLKLKLARRSFYENQRMGTSTTWSLKCCHPNLNLGLWALKSLGWPEDLTPRFHLSGTFLDLRWVTPKDIMESYSFSCQSSQRIARYCLPCPPSPNNNDRHVKLHRIPAVLISPLNHHSLTVCTALSFVAPTFHGPSFRLK